MRGKKEREEIQRETETFFSSFFLLLLRFCFFSFLQRAPSKNYKKKHLFILWDEKRAVRLFDRVSDLCALKCWERKRGSEEEEEEVEKK